MSDPFASFGDKLDQEVARQDQLTHGVTSDESATTFTPASAPTPAATQDNDPFASFGQKLDTEESDIVSRALKAAEATDPEVYGRAMRVAKMDQLPIEQAINELSGREKRVELSQVRQVLSANPTLRQFFSTSYYGNVTSRDDLDLLGTQQDFLAGVKQGWETGQNQTATGDYGWKQLMGGKLTPEEQNDLDLRQASTPSGEYTTNWFTSIPAATAEMLPYAISSGWAAAQAYLGVSAGGALVGGVAGATAGGVGAVPGAAAGMAYVQPAAAGAAATAAFQNTMRIEAGNAYLDLQDVKGVDGQPLDPNVSRLGALLVGAINGGLEVTGEAALVKLMGIPAGMSKMGVRQVVKKMLSVPTTQAALANVVKKMGGAVGTEVSTEVLQEVSQIVGTEAAKALSPGQFESDSPQQVMERLLNIGSKTTQATIPFAMLGLRSHIREEFGRVRSAEQNLKTTQALSDLAQKYNLKERDPEAADAGVQAIGAATGQTEVHVPVAALETLFQKEGAAGEAMAQALPGFWDYFNEAKRTGQDVAIPIEVFHNRLAGTALGEALLPDTRFSPDLPTLNEITEYRNSEGDRQASFQEQLDQLQLDADSKQAQHDQILQAETAKLVAAGMPEDIARQNAALTAAYYMTQAQRRGVDPIDLHSANAPSVERVFEGTGTPVAQGETALPQGTPGDAFRRYGDFTARDVSAEPGYVYHATSAERADSIGRDGAVDVFDPSFGTDQQVWPDGRTEPRSYWTATPSTARLFTPEGKPVLLRTARDGNFRDERHTKDIYTTQATPTDRVEFLAEDGTWQPLTSPDELFQSANELRRDPSILLREFGLEGKVVKKTGKLSVNTRKLAEGLDRWSRARSGEIDPNDRSDESADKIGGWIAEEVEYELLPENLAGSAAGWYTVKWQAAIDRFGAIFPELLTDQEKRDTFTLAFAIMSDGQKVFANARLAVQIYEFFRTTGRWPEGDEFQGGGERRLGMTGNLAILNGLIRQHGSMRAAIDKMMEVDTVSNLKKLAKAAGTELDTEYTAKMTLPLSAVLLGPKLGAFFANLMGSTGYLTMDRWWTRSINRMRGQMVPPVSESLRRDFAALVGLPADASDAMLLPFIIEGESRYKKAKFKKDKLIEQWGADYEPIAVKANGLYKQMFTETNDQPFNSTDREFQVKAAALAQQKLADRGISMTIADIQAVMWYYEKRLFAELGVRPSGDVSYAEAANIIVEERLGGDRSGGSDLEGVRGDVAGNPAEDAGTEEGAETLNQDAPVPQPIVGGRIDWHGLVAGKEDVIGGQLGRSFDEVYATAEELQVELVADAALIAAKLGVEMKNPGVKDLETSFSKIARKGYSGPDQLTDIARLAFVIDHPEQAQAIVEAMARVHVLLDEGLQTNTWGYADQKLLVRGHNGAVGEVQILFRPMAEAKSDGGHQIYDHARELPDENPAKWAAMAQSRAHYSEALAALAVSSASSSGGNGSSLSRANRAENSSSVTSLPSSGDPLDQSRSLADQSTVTPEGPVTAGRPSSSIQDQAPGSQNGTVIADTSSNIVQVTQPADKQSLAQGVRGSVTFRPGGQRAVIRLFEAQDLSTFQHEMGHVYLRNARDFALNTLDKDAVADWAVIGEYLGVGANGQLTVEMEEKWARTWERYLYEGKAPTEALRGVFSRFAAWLKFVYRSAVQLNAPITPEIMAVMDRMLATDEELAGQSASPAFQSIFQTAEEAGMSPKQFEAYQQRMGRAIEAAEAELQAQFMNDLRRELTKEWRKRRKEIRDEVEAKARANPVHQARQVLAGRQPLEGTPNIPLDIKLWIPELEGRYTPEQVAALKRQGITTDPEAGGIKGMFLDDVADMFGFQSGDQMVQGLLITPTLQRDVATQVQQRMLSQYGTLLGDQSARVDAAKASMHQEARAQAIEMELEALAKKDVMGGVVAKGALAIAKALAANQIALRQADQLKATPYIAAERRAAQDTLRAVARKDWRAAAEFKRRQLHAHEMARAIKEAQGEVEKAVRFLKRYADEKRPDGVAWDYLDQIDALLARFEVRGDTARQAKRRTSLRAYIEEQEALGNVVDIDPKLLDEAYTKSWRQMTVDDIRSLRDAVKQLATLGRLKQKLLDGQAERERAQVLGELIAQAQKQRQRGITDPRELEAKNKITRWWNKVQETGLGSLASLARWEQVIDFLDGGDINGPWRRVIFNRFVEAQNAENDLHVTLTNQLLDVLNDMDGNYLRQGVYLPSIDKTYTKEQIYAIALNTGALSNLDKMMRGEAMVPGGGLDNELKLNEALNALTTEDMDRIQQIWDVINGMWPQLEALQKRLTGVAPEKVEARSFEFKGKTYRGGYYPMVYDPEMSPQVERNADAASDRLMADKSFIQPVVQSGHRISRTNFAAPVSLELRVVADHLAKVVHDVTHWEAVRDVYSVLSDPAIVSQLDETFGREVRKSSIVWVNRVANSRKVNAPTGFGRVFSVARNHASLMGMGFRFSTAIAQVVGFSNSLEHVSIANMASALLKAPEIVTGTGVSVWIKEQSGEMRHRQNTLERAIVENVQRVTEPGILSEFRRFAFYGIAFMDRLVSETTWLAGYNDHLQKNPGDHPGAVMNGDRSVRLSQGAGSAKDISAIENDKGIVSLFTQFYSYFNLYFNRLWALARDTKTAAIDGTLIRDTPQLLARLVFHTLAPAILGELIVGRGPDDDDRKKEGEAKAWAKWAATRVALYPASSVPVLRDVASMIAGAGGRTTITAPAMRPFELAAQVVNQFGQDELHARQIAKAVAQIPGYVFGIPMGQVITTGDNIWHGLEKNDFKLRDLLLSREANR